MRRALEPAIVYQPDCGVHICLGEFTAIRWAPGGSALACLCNCSKIPEENGWDWVYHATPTERKQLLKPWYARNSK